MSHERSLKRRPFSLCTRGFCRKWASYALPHEQNRADAGRWIWSAKALRSRELRDGTTAEAYALDCSARTRGASRREVEPLRGSGVC
jgi:hypothetical protein